MATAILKLKWDQNAESETAILSPRRPPPLKSGEGAVQLLKVDGKHVTIVNERLLYESKSFIGFIGPPGTGKSSLCNTAIYCHQFTKPEKPYFEPSDTHKTFTKGIWILSPTTKHLFPYDCDWEVLDMEGFQPLSESCWKLAMVLSILAEIVVFCNNRNNDRFDAVFDAAKVFASGMKLCKKLSMSPVTKQLFVQVSKKVLGTPERLDPIIRDVKDIIQSPDITITPFCVPDLSGLNMDMNELPYHPTIVDTIRNQVILKFQLDKDGQAAAAKADKLSALLKAFNSRNFDECDRLGLQFLQMDCKRIYMQAIAEHHGKHNKLAAEKEVLSVDTTFEEFIAEVDWSLDLPLEDSPFYLDKYVPQLDEWYSNDARWKEIPDVYRTYYDGKMAEFKATLETIRLQQVAEEAKVAAEKAQAEIDEISRTTNVIRQAAEEELEATLIAEGDARAARQRAEETARQIEIETQDQLVAQRIAAEEAINAAKEQAEKEQREAEASRGRAEEAARLAKLAEIAENQAAFRREVNAAIQAAKEKLGTDIAVLENKYRPLYKDGLFEEWNHYIETMSIERFASERNLSMDADWTPFQAHYNSEKARLKQKWQKQIETAKWKSPVKAMGTLKCEGGHDLTDTVICKCDGKLFWVDGPHRVAICQECNDVSKIGDSLKCRACGKASLSTVRPSEYMP